MTQFRDEQQQRLKAQKGIRQKEEEEVVKKKSVAEVKQARDISYLHEKSLDNSTASALRYLRERDEIGKDQDNMRQKEIAGALVWDIEWGGDVYFPLKLASGHAEIFLLFAMEKAQSLREIAFNAISLRLIGIMR